ELALHVIHRYRPEGVHGRELILRKGERVVMLAGIERLTIGESLGHGIHGLDRVVAVDTRLGGGGSLEPVAVIKSAVAKERTYFPAVDVLLSGLEILLDLFFAFLNALHHCSLLLLRPGSEVKLLARF